MLGAVIAGQPAGVRAQTNAGPATAGKSGAEHKETTAVKRSAGPFRGKLAAVDKVAKTITVGKRTFQITSDTRIMKGGKPAALADGVIGEPVSGGFKTAEGGKLVATKVTFGPKPEAKAAEKKTEAVK